jgi:cyclophilin family peptidyl-prolyl cis-trans isomerase
VERNPKRARKKEARDQRTAAMMAAYRRRRAARIAAVFAAVVAIVSLMLYATRNDEPDTPSATNETEDTTEPENEEDQGDAQAEEAPCPEVEAPESDPVTDYGSAPQQEEVLEEGVDYSAIIHTSCGNIEVDLLEERRATVTNFVFLAREGYYDGLTWHRVEGNFVIQTGDPNGINGEPPDGPGYTIPDEVEGTRSADYVYGTLAMANRAPEPNTGGSQFFFIVHDPQAAMEGEAPEPAGLEPLYTIFGRASKKSYDVLDKIARQPTEATTSTPRIPVYIESIEILEK